MRAIYLVPVFAIPLAAAWVTERSSFAQVVAQAAAAPQAASDECLSKPGASAPQGSHWYYRINRTDRRHCWYLGSDSARTRAREAAARSSTRKPIRQRTAGHIAEAAPAQITPAEAVSGPEPSAQAAPTPIRRAETTANETDPGREFAGRWPNLPSSIDLNSRRSAAAASNSYTEEHAAKDAHDDMPLVWPVLTSAEAPAAKPAMESMATWVYILGLLSGSLALAAVLLRAIGNRAAARRVVCAESTDRRHIPSRPGQQMTERSQFAEALAAALHADALSSSIVDVCKVDLARPLMTPAQEARASDGEERASDGEERAPADDVEVCLERLLNGWQRVAA
jgi:hypothetical protein